MGTVAPNRVAIGMKILILGGTERYFVLSQLLDAFRLSELRQAMRRR